jgi:glycosyltransferase involved in cell wall biosynthesis
MSSLHIGTITFDWYFTDARVIRLVEAAADAGYRVDVICLRQPHEKSYEARNGVHLYRVPMSRGFGRSLPVTILSWCWFLLLASVTVTWLHLKRPYHVIHVHNLPDFLVFSTLLPRLLGAKIILDVQDTSPELMAAKAKSHLQTTIVRLAKLQERSSTSFANHVVTAAWPFEKLLLQRGVPEKKLTVIINSTDSKIFPAALRQPISPNPPDESRPFILMYYGTVAERHGLDIAVQALALALRAVPHVRLDIKGRGEHLIKVKQLSEELGVSDHVVFCESSPVQEVVHSIAGIDAGIIPYQCDGFTELLLPTKAYELAWMHRPIIASDTPGIRSMFRPESIALCDPSSPESFADAIVDLYLHPEKRARMVTSAAEDYKPYQWEVMAKHYQQLLASLSRKREQKRKRYP